MQFRPTDRFLVSSEVLSQEVNGETVLLDLDGESYFTLNQVGTRIWQLLMEGPVLADMLDILSAEYEVESTQLEKEVENLLEQLAETGLVSVRHA